MFAQKKLINSFFFFFFATEEINKELSREISMGSDCD